MQKLAVFLLEKKWLCLALIVALYCVPYASCFGVLLALMYTLSYDLRNSVLALAALLVPAIALGFWQYQSLQWFIPLSIVFIWFSAWILQRFRSWSDVFNFAALFVIVLIPLIYLIKPDIQSTWLVFWAWVMNFIGMYVQSMDSLVSSAIPLSISGEWSNFISYLASHHVNAFLAKISTGLLLSGYVLSGLCLLIVARAWYLWYKESGSVALELRQIRLHISATLALLLLLVSQHFNLIYRLDMLCALSILFFLAGLSLVHDLAHWRGKPWIGLLIIYSLLTFLPKAMSVFLIVLACLDSMIDVRKKFKEVIDNANHSARKNS
ncbi:MAG: hypothetical protein HKM04_00935 [Legionellales bacterium]|nr:hypothetical protein [Legionellales bacterium]